MDEVARPSVRGTLERMLPALVGLALVLSTIPMFFAIYREAAFHSTPFDDYAPSLLALVGERGTERLDFPGNPPARIPTTLQNAPMGYRILSVAAAVPFYYALPYYPFSGLENPDEKYLRAQAALDMVSYLSMLLSVLVVYLIARRRLRCSIAASLITALFAFGMFQFLGTIGVDALAVLVISLLVFFIDRPAVFVPLVVISAFTNEKIVLIFTVVFGARLLWWLVESRKDYRYWPQTIATGVAFALYFGMRQVLRLPGWENQTDPGTWLSGAESTVRASLSLKGFIQNGIPLFVMAILMLAVVAIWTQRRSIWRFSRLDLLAAPALLALGTFIDMQFTVGRLVMHTFPLYLPLLALFVDAYLIRPALLERDAEPVAAATASAHAPVAQALAASPVSREP